MQTFAPRFKAGGTKPIEQRFQEFLFAQLEQVPPNFRGRYHGPVMALPRFMHKWLYYPTTGTRFEKFRYSVVDGYELAAIIFFPATAGLHAGAVYRIDFEMMALDYEDIKGLGDGKD